ncbi:MAG TPA: D-Ala-D-Ala carboxypeptidase family metallohydrolase [Symbiobacteriaceae bacterium]|jgi:hypothetical protein
MRFVMSKRSILLVVLATLLSILGAAPNASAASQTISASMTSVTTTGFGLSLSWSTVSGADHYDVRYEYNPSVDLVGSSLFATVYTNSISATMSSSIGYRFFRIYAYDSANTLLAYSNVVAMAKYPSGLVVRMKTDSALTGTYPDPSGSPNASYYQKPVWFITVDSTVRSSYAATNFQIGEFINDASLTSALVDPLMVQHTQNARIRYGPMSINSGYRTPDYNRSIGGATYSRHLYGDAVDVPASTSSTWTAVDNAFALENPSYVESWAEAGYNHWHGDWRYESKGYQNW